MKHIGPESNPREDALVDALVASRLCFASEKAYQDEIRMRVLPRALTLGENYRFRMKLKENFKDECRAADFLTQFSGRDTFGHLFTPVNLDNLMPFQVQPLNWNLGENGLIILRSGRELGYLLGATEELGATLGRIATHAQNPNPFELSIT